MTMQARGARIEGWDHFDPFHLYAVKPSGVPAEPMPGIERAAGPGPIDVANARPWHPDSPLFWVGALLAVTLGFIGASTTVRFGPFKAAVAAGKA